MSNVITFPSPPLTGEASLDTFESVVRDTLRLTRARLGGGSDLDGDRVRYACLVHDAMRRHIPVQGRMALPCTLDLSEIEAIRSEISYFVPGIVDAVLQHCAEEFAQAVVVLSCPNLIRTEIETLEGNYNDER